MSYEKDFAQWVKTARADSRRPIEAAIASLLQVRQELREATLSNRDQKLKDLGKIFDEATIHFDPQMKASVLRSLEPITRLFDRALREYSAAVRKERGVFSERNQVRQHELAILKLDAGNALDKLTAWFKAIPT